LRDSLRRGGQLTVLARRVTVMQAELIDTLRADGWTWVIGAAIGVSSGRVAARADPSHR